MYFYEVWVRSGKFHGHEPLTYSHGSLLPPGTVVTVPLRQDSVLGLVTGKVVKPDFATKPLKSVLADLMVPRRLLELLDWLKDYYPAPVGPITQLFLPPGLLKASLSIPEPVDFDTTPSAPLPKLTEEQAAVVDEITGRKAGPTLIHGNTGTGKTRVYMELARRSLADNRSVLILTPEIGLTPQLAGTFEKYFAHTVVTMHSHLTEAERRDAWLSIMTSSKPLIVVGPRSALFAPLKDIGLVVVDESHEGAYKQEQAPYYYAPRVAARLAQLHGASLLFGTATPPVSEYYLAEQKRIPILRMKSLALGKAQPTETHLVNLRERQHFSRQFYLSDKMLDCIADATRRNEQSLVFLNRRGTARLVLCQVCGWQVTCPRCDIPMTYHGDSHRLLCHTCGKTAQPPVTCLSCGSTDIIFKSIGTKAIVDALKKEFPRARIQRFDTDNLKSERFEQHYQAVRDGKVDILVGTQMLAKGLDLPRLSVLGVVLADSSLYFPDFTAEERTYQLLTQILGRIGRGHNQQPTAIIQTYHPDSRAIQSAIDKDWQGFYDSQLEERRNYLFPPFCHVLKLQCERRSSAAAKQAAEKLISSLGEQGFKVILIGPSPAFNEKVGGKYRWHVIAKAKRRSELLKIIAVLPPGYSYDIDPTSLL